MIEPATGNFWDHPADARVNTVNCVGVMGKGVALQFKLRYPRMFTDYLLACRRGDAQPGRLHVWTDPTTNLMVINLPTKRHWRDPSPLADINAGLDALRTFADTLPPGTRITLPPPGCGLGGLRWSQVGPLVAHHLSESTAHFLVFQPKEASR
jgi:O-acetyl-ADP-ribose deacetylase (regulator of RNase III)